MSSSKSTTWEVLYKLAILEARSGGGVSGSEDTQGRSSEEDRVKFLQEAAIMGQFKHANIVTMYGVVKEGEPVSIVRYSTRSLITAYKFLFVRCCFLLLLLFFTFIE